MASTSVRFHTLQLDLNKNFLQLSMLSDNNEKLLCGILGTGLPNIPEIVNTSNDILEVEVSGSYHLKVQHVPISASQHRYDFDWLSHKAKELQNIFDMSGAHWYGGAHVRKQVWPIEQMNMKLIPFIAGDSFKDSNYGGVQERYFLSSRGVAVFIDPLVPLFIGINGDNDKNLIISAKYEWPYVNHDQNPLSLNYSIFQGDNVREVHDQVAKQKIPKPTNIPDTVLFRHPIWSTWASYKRNINQESVLDFGDEIIKRGFSAAQLEIDDDWTPAYGDMEFNKKKFSDPHRMVKELQEKGLRVTLWVHPFANLTSHAAGHKFWVTSGLKGYSTWWNGIGKCLDITNPAAVAWFKGCLQNLKEKYGITSFKFDAGEINWLPSRFVTQAKLATPNMYSKLYAEMCYDIDQDIRAQEVRVGIQTQHLPILVRMMDKDSCWGYDNGLKTLIPHALTFGIIGYPFVLPDMVGGNAYHGLPDRELYIRWIEANALLPCVQISIPPWKYDQEIVDISHKMLKLHEAYADLIIALAKESTVTGTPIVRPIWWNSPKDETAQHLDSEFLLGDDVLVAPVLDPGKTSRSIYLPCGKWKCALTGNVLEGGQWYKDCPARLEDLPHFTRLPNTS